MRRRKRELLVVRVTRHKTWVLIIALITFAARVMNITTTVGTARDVLRNCADIVLMTYQYQHSMKNNVPSYPKSSLQQIKRVYVETARKYFRSSELRFYHSRKAGFIAPFVALARVPTPHSAYLGDCAAIVRFRNWQLKLRPSGIARGVGHISLLPEPRKTEPPPPGVVCPKGGS